MTRTVEECPHGGDPYSCPPCQRADDQGHAPGPVRPRTFAARYPGNCTGCGALIMPGDRIAADPDGDGYLDEECLP